jgi:hypothetical protein
MKAQCSRNKDAEDRLANLTNKGAPSWPLLPGILLANFGLLLIGLAGWYALSTGTQSFLYSGGGILCVAGLVLIWIGTIKLADAAHEPAVRSKPNCPGYVLMNRHFLKA